MYKKSWTVALPQILCQLYMITQSNMTVNELVVRAHLSMCGFGNWWQSLWTNGFLELYSKDLSIGTSWSPSVGFKEFIWWPRWYSRCYPKIGHMRVECIASMSWRRRLCEHSCLPSRHHLCEERREDTRLIKIKAKNDSSWSTHKA